MSDISITNGHSVVPVPDQAERQQQLPTMYDPTADQLSGWASWDVTTEEGFALLSTIKHGDKQALADRIGETIQVRNVYVQPVDAVDEATGEVSRYPWICLQLADGTVLTCGSIGVFGSIRDALKFRPTTPWEPPLQFKIVQRQTAGKNRIFGLLYMPTAPASQPKKGGGRGA